MKGNHYTKPKLRFKGCMASKPGILRSSVRHLIEEADKVQPHILANQDFRMGIREEYIG
jgi:hypothetical protein